MNYFSTLSRYFYNHSHRKKTFFFSDKPNKLVFTGLGETTESAIDFALNFTSMYSN